MVTPTGSAPSFTDIAVRVSRRVRHLVYAFRDACPKETTGSFDEQYLQQVHVSERFATAVACQPPTELVDVEMEVNAIDSDQLVAFVTLRRTNSHNDYKALHDLAAVLTDNLRINYGDVTRTGDGDSGIVRAIRLRVILPLHPQAPTVDPDTGEDGFARCVAGNVYALLEGAPAVLTGRDPTLSSRLQFRFPVGGRTPVIELSVVYSRRGGTFHLQLPDDEYDMQLSFAQILRLLQGESGYQLLHVQTHTTPLSLRFTLVRTTE